MLLGITSMIHMQQHEYITLKDIIPQNKQAETVC